MIVDVLGVDQPVIHLDVLVFRQKCLDQLVILTLEGTERLPSASIVALIEPFHKEQWFI